MSWLSAALLPLLELERNALADYAAGIRIAFNRDPFDAWVMDARPMTYGEFLAQLPLEIVNAGASPAAPAPRQAADCVRPGRLP